MFCKNCNTQLPDNATFCKNCGARLTQESAGPAKPQTVIQPPEPPMGHMASQMNRQGGYYPQQQPQRASTLKIVGLTLAAVVAVGGVFFAVSGSDAKDKPSTEVSEPAAPGGSSTKQDKNQPSQAQPQQNQQPAAAAGTLAIKEKNLKVSLKETGQQLLTIADAQISFDASGRPQLCFLYQNDTGKQVKSLDLLVRAVGPNGEFMKSPVTGDTVQAVELNRVLAPGAATSASDVIPLTDLPQAGKYQVVISCINYADSSYLMFDYDYRPTLVLE